MKKASLIIVLSLILFSCNRSSIQNLNDEEIISLIFNEAQISNKAYTDLKYLTEKFPQRLACYPQGIEAAKWTKKVMDEMNLDKVFLQEAQVMSWKRGNI